MSYAERTKVNVRELCEKKYEPPLDIRKEVECRKRMNFVFNQIPDNVTRPDVINELERIYNKDISDIASIVGSLNYKRRTIDVQFIDYEDRARIFTHGITIKGVKYGPYVQERNSCYFPNLPSWMSIKVLKEVLTFRGMKPKKFIRQADRFNGIMANAVTVHCEPKTMILPYLKFEDKRYAILSNSEYQIKLSNDNWEQENEPTGDWGSTADPLHEEEDPLSGGQQTQGDQHEYQTQTQEASEEDTIRDEQHTGKNKETNIKTKRDRSNNTNDQDEQDSTEEGYETPEILQSSDSDTETEFKEVKRKGKKKNLLTSPPMLRTRLQGKDTIC